MRRLVPFLAGALLLAAGPVLTAKVRPTPCDPGRFLLRDGPLLADSPPTLVDAVIVGPAMDLSLGCVRSGRQRMKATRKGTKVLATFKSCPGLKGRVKLNATIVEDCGVLQGHITAKKYRREFRAPRSICGDGFVDPGLGETCEDASDCDPAVRCLTDTCRCEGGSGASTTTTTTTSSQPGSSSSITTSTFTSSSGGVSTTTTSSTTTTASTTSTTTLQPVTILQGSSPANGEGGVAVTRETVLRFSRPLAPTVTPAAAIDALFAGSSLHPRFNVSPDRKTVTLFYGVLPASARIRVRVDGGRLRDQDGALVDGDRDGVPGGVALIDFDTLTLSTIPGTAVCGRVFASDLCTTGDGAQVNCPLAGVTITVDGAASTMHTVTDANGNFRLDPAPAADFFVHVDGRTVTSATIDGQQVATSYPDGPYYPFVGKKWSPQAGRETNIGEIYLPLISAQSLKPVSATADTTVTLPPEIVAARPELQGVAITVPANSLYDDNGVRGGMVGIAPVQPDRLPGPLPPGLEFPLVITVQTAGGDPNLSPMNFDVPVPVCFPNLPMKGHLDVLPPGAKSALWSFNHDTGAWEVIGSMTVTPDGRLVCSDPGEGIRAPGWHGTLDGAEMATPAHQPCEAFGIDQAYDIVKAVFDCLRKVTRLLRAIGTIVDALDHFIDFTDDLTNIRNDYAAGRLDKDTLRSYLDAIKNGKEQAKDLNELLDVADPVKKLFDGADCAIGIADSVLGALCDTLGCTNKYTQFICSKAVPIIDFAHTLEGYAEEIEDNVKNQPVLLACAALEGLILHIELLPDAGARAAGVAQPDPSVLALMDDALAKAATAEAALSPLRGLVQALQAGETLEGAVASALADELVTVGGIGNDPYLLIIAGQEIRGRASSLGQFTIRVSAESDYHLEVLDLSHGAILQAVGRTPGNGERGEFGPFSVVLLDGEPDGDGDGLPDLAEPILGTDPQSRDSDADGVSDGAEVEQGSDPLDGMASSTGIVASAVTPASAVDVCSLNDVTVVAHGDRGISAFNVFNGMNPTIVAQVDMPGWAGAVACDDTLLAVADGDRGLAVIDIVDPPAATITHQIAFGSNARAVSASAGIAYVGLQSGDIVSVDLATGTRLDSVSIGSSIEDLTIGSDYLYALTIGRVFAIPLSGGSLQIEGSAASPGGGQCCGRRLRLFAGGHALYATHNRGYNTFDIDNPGHPNLIAAGTTAQFGWKQIVPNGSGLAMAAVGPNLNDDPPHDVSLYDVSDPTKTGVFLTEFPTPGIATAVSIFNGLAYVADGDAGLQVVNYLPYDTKGVPPTIALRTNYALDRAEEGQVFRVTADVSDDVQVRNVEFLVDGIRVVTDGNFPFEHRFLVPRLSRQSSFTIRAIATDTGGNAADSGSVVVTIVPDATPPKVRSVSPPDRSFRPNVAAVAAFFSEPMDATSLAGNGFTVTAAGVDGSFGTGDDVPVTGGRFDFREDVLAGFLTFPSSLQPGVYRAVVTAGARDVSGNALGADFAWTFTIFDLSDDSDHDCLPDALELELGLDPHNPDSKGDGLLDGERDSDGDGVLNCEEILSGLDPADPDTDDDGLCEGHHLGPVQNQNGVQVCVGGEADAGTNPLVGDTDGDGFSDGDEVRVGSDPTDGNRLPVDPHGSLGEVEGSSFSILNKADPTSRPDRPTPTPALVVGEVGGAAVSVLNAAAPGIRADGQPINASDVTGEVESRWFSVRNDLPLAIDTQRGMAPPGFATAEMANLTLSVSNDGSASTSIAALGPIQPFSSVQNSEGPMSPTLDTRSSGE